MVTNKLGNEIKYSTKKDALEAVEKYKIAFEYMSDELYDDNTKKEYKYNLILSHIKINKMYKINVTNVNIDNLEDFEFIFNTLSNDKKINDYSTLKEKWKVINEIINLIDYILNSKGIYRKNSILYILFRYCLPYNYGRNMFLNREYQPLFFPIYGLGKKENDISKNFIFFKTKEEDEIEFKYLYNDGNNPSNYLIFNKKYWEEYKQKLFSFIEKYK